MKVSIDRVECFYDSKFYNSFTHETLHGGAMVMCTQHTYMYMHDVPNCSLCRIIIIIVVACIIRSILV